MKTNTIRVQKHERIKNVTSLMVNRSITGDSIEIMLERLREGEGEEGIADRDLVYNDGESGIVNPITNIRSDKMELMLEEKIGEQEHRKNKHNKKINEDIDKVVEEENKKLNKENGSEKANETE